MRRDQNPTLSKRPFFRHRSKLRKRLFERIERALTKQRYHHKWLRRLKWCARLSPEQIISLYHITRQAVKGVIPKSAPTNYFSAEHSQTARNRQCTRRPISARSISHSYLRASKHSLLRFAERYRGVDIAELSREVEASIAQQPDALRRDPNAQLIELLLATKPSLVRLWEEQLLARLQPYLGWPSRTFDVIDRTRWLRFVVKNGVVVSVLPVRRRDRW